MEFADENLKISNIINAEKEEEITQKASDNTSDGSKRMTFNREKFDTSMS